MKNNKKIYNYLDTLSIKQLECLVKQKRVEIEISKLNIVKKNLINQKIDK